MAVDVLPRSSCGKHQLVRTDADDMPVFLVCVTDIEVEYATDLGDTFCDWEGYPEFWARVARKRVEEEVVYCLE